MIDPHVHLRDGQLSEKETIEHGIKTAYAAGFKAFFDMPNTVPPLTTAEAAAERIRLGQQKAAAVSSEVFYGVYGGVTCDERQLKEMVQFYKTAFPSITGLKMFAGHSTGNMGLTEKAMQKKVYTILAGQNYCGVLAIHCEKESCMHPEIWNPEFPESHSKARPSKAETESIKDQIELASAADFGGTIHICHISTAEGLNLVCSARQKGMKITCGATPHHSLLNINSYSEKGIFVKMNPPLREEKDRTAIFKGLLDGSIDWIESDHAPHTIKDKEKGASGIPGFAGMLLLIKALRGAGCTEERLFSLCGGNVNKTFRMKLPVSLPSNEKIDEILPLLRKAYPFDVFKI